MRMLSFFCVLLFASQSPSLVGQVSNSTCGGAIAIEDPSEYCSGNTEFTNVQAGGSEVSDSDCFSGAMNDVWFSFIAQGSAVNIVVNGDLGGTLQDPIVGVYQGTCNSIELFECEAATPGPDVVNLLIGDLVIGTKYSVRVAGSGANSGNFQLCVNNFNPPNTPGQDGEDAALLCDKAGFVIQALDGGGSDNNEAAGTCLDVGFAATENQSSWTTWIADNNGELTFSITPINVNDDIDFVLYELPNGVGNFAGKIAIRCMASSCIGATGLNSTADDLTEAPGCGGGDDNFLRSLIQEEGKAYALLINNFSNTGIGISLTFGGDAEFKGPDPDFDIEVTDNILTCDKIINVIDNSQSNIGNITRLEWNFGEDASPQTAEGMGPFEISYPNFGTKYISLTISSDLGCRTTQIREIEVLPCCADADAVNIEVLDKQNIGCGMSLLGGFTIEGSGGFPNYQYRLNGGEYGDNARFDNLVLGDYEVEMIDSKGCEVSRTISIIEVESVLVDAGEDDAVEYLGDAIQLQGSYEASGDVSISWTPSDQLVCPDEGPTCLDPLVTPIGTTTYILSVTDDNGCTSTDDVVIEVLNIRPLFAANVFSPNDDGINDIFSLSGNPFSVSNIELLEVFDRWGNKVYQGRNLSPDDITSGWDGRANGVLLDEGVYIWFARLEFLDPELEPEVITGDVTLLR